MHSILFSANPEQARMEDIINHLKNHKMVYFNVNYPINWDQFIFPMMGFIHITGTGQVQCCVEISNIETYRDEHYENEELKPPEWRVRWLENPNEIRSKGKCAYIITGLTKFEYKTTELIRSNGEPVTHAPEGYIKIIAPYGEEAFQSAVQYASPELPEEGPINRQEKNVVLTTSYPRKPKYSKEALVKAQYKCEHDNSHKTFTHPATGKNFMEAHHLIPMEFQEYFVNSIDFPENIISLCPNCHRAIHKADFNEIEKMITTFCGKRLDSLKKRGIKVSLKKIISYYKD